MSGTDPQSQKTELEAAARRLLKSLERLSAASESAPLPQSDGAAGEALSALEAECEKLRHENAALREQLSAAQNDYETLEQRNLAAIGQLDEVIGQIRSVLDS